MHDVLLNRPRPNARVSVILLDWGVRESFHSLHYLNRQSAPRDRYDLIWIEFYDRRPVGLQEAVEKAGGDGPVLDKWIVLGYGPEVCFHKHRMYNVGILAADGDICVICDSDAIFEPTFIDRIVRAFEECPERVVHIDEVRNQSRKFYPFNFPSLSEVLVPDECINWNGMTTRGLEAVEDKLHEANYGACMAARREDLIAIGGADEHVDYLGYICGPYELTFRLKNFGREEVWLEDEFIYHVWHPGESVFNVDYQGPNDGRGMSTAALECLESGSIEPKLLNRAIGEIREGDDFDLGHVLADLQEDSAPAWREIAERFRVDHSVREIELGFHGYNLYAFGNLFYGLPEELGAFEPEMFEKGEYEGVCLVSYREDGLRGLVLVENPPKGGPVSEVAEQPASWWRIFADRFGKRFR